MIAFTKHLVDSVQDRFIALMPQIKQQAAVAFRSRRPEERAELVQEVVANSFVAFARLVELGKQDVAYATPLTMYAVRQVLAGRRVGTKLNVRDVLSPANRRIVVEHLDQFDRDGRWKEVLVEDRHTGPAETAAARIDFGQWIRSLSARNRRIAKTLAGGESTQVTAKKFGLTEGRVSQLRREMATSWRQLQGEPVTA